MRKQKLRKQINLLLFLQINTALSLPDHRAVVHSKGKNWGVPGKVWVMIFWLLQYLYDKHVHLHETGKGSF